MADEPIYAELPQIGISAKGDRREINLYLTVDFQTAHFEFFICDTTNYEQAARSIHKGIMDAGVEARRNKSGIIVAGGDVNATVPKPERRK